MMSSRFDNSTVRDDFSASSFEILSEPSPLLLREFVRCCAATDDDDVDNVVDDEGDDGVVDGAGSASLFAEFGRLIDDDDDDDD